MLPYFNHLLHLDRSKPLPTPEIEQYYSKGGLWSPSYSIASCGGAPLDIVKQYIENQ